MGWIGSGRVGSSSGGGTAGFVEWERTGWGRRVGEGREGTSSGSGRGGYGRARRMGEVGNGQVGTGLGGVRAFSGAEIQFCAKLESIVELDTKYLPVPVTAYSQTSTLRSR